MNRQRSAILLFILVLLLAGSGVQAAEMTWGDSLEKAVRLAKKTGKPILIDFYADWCGWCKRLDKDVYTDSTVIKTAGQFIPVKLNSEQNGLEAAKKYGVRSLPTILVLNAEGTVEARLNGYFPAPVFNARLVEAAQVHHELPELQSRYRSNANDLEAATRLTRIYSRRGEEGQAQRSLARVAKLDPTDTKGSYAKSLNIVADMYASRGNFDEAIPLFRRAVRTAHNNEDLGYGQLSIAVCLFYQRNLDATRTELKAAIDNPKITEKFKSDARKMLAKVDELAKQQGG